jgi:predicted ester cyclase
MGESRMAVESNKVVARRYATEAWGQGRMETVDELCAADVVISGMGGRIVRRGTTEVKELISFVRRVIPDLCMNVEEELADSDQVIFRWSSGGTQRGEWVKGVPPTGKPVAWTGISIYRIANGRILEERFEEDLLHLMEQMGVIQSTRANPT